MCLTIMAEGRLDSSHQHNGGCGSPPPQPRECSFNSSRAGISHGCTRAKECQLVADISMKKATVLDAGKANKIAAENRLRSGCEVTWQLCLSRILLADLNADGTKWLVIRNTLKLPAATAVVRYLTRSARHSFPRKLILRGRRRLYVPVFSVGLPP